MRVAITGNQRWGEHADAAEEVIAGFVSKLPKNTNVIVGGLEDGVELWVGRYAKAYKFNVTEILPAHVKGAAHHVRNYSLRDQHISEKADRVFCFVYAGVETEAEVAGLMTQVRLHHVGHTVYTLAPDEENSERLKLVDSETVEPIQLLPKNEEVKNSDTGRSPVHRKSNSRTKSTGRVRTKKSQPARSAASPRTSGPTKERTGKSIVLTRRSFGEAHHSRPAVRSPKSLGGGTAGSRQRKEEASRSKSKRIVLTRKV